MDLILYALLKGKTGASGSSISEEEVINLLVETGFISPATTSNGDIYTNVKGDIYVD